MKRYFWKETVTNNGIKSEVNVYEQCKDGSFYFLGSMISNRGSYRGGRAIANQILHDKFKYKWSEPTGDTHYWLKRKDITLIRLP